MIMRIDDLKRRINDLISQADQVLNTAQASGDGKIRWVNGEKFYAFRTAALSFLKNTFGESDPYYQEFNQQAHSFTFMEESTENSRGILSAVKQEIDGGWLFTVKGLISAEIFADFLEMAQYLLNEGYKDAAAIMSGSVLEEHLRQLCIKNSIPVENIKDGKPKKANQLNDELAANSVYNKLDQKSVTAWLDLRNKAAHGKYNEYAKDQVVLMHQGVTDFMSRNVI
jgi:uncharacterized protein (DUF2164 family)